ncbi:MotA/TolQ/ExbB proton channel family protein [Akkermansiaceae bacterium]|nr:MotA/TolQ/ExbB proton channel family protein [Akkermansiaceae bacterium]
MHSQLETLPPEHAAILIRKKRFWKKTMWISLGVGVMLAMIAVSGTVIKMTAAFSSLQANGSADPSVLAGDISEAMLISLWSLPPALLAFLIFLVSLIRCLSLPKLPENSTQAG